MRTAAAALVVLALMGVAAGGVGARSELSPTDPLAGAQWYAKRTRAFGAWDVLPPLAPIRIGIIDSGVDLGHPDLAGRVVKAKSFVGGSARDTRGHGTIVAGLVAAGLDNGVGIAGLAPTAELLVAKVVDDAGSISVAAEARAVRWAVDNGARVLNMSLSGVRDPRDPDVDTFSRVEADAIAYAVERGVLVVAAVGNGDQSPREPWPFAGYPAALPHVLGVSASTRIGASPAFSNRDPIYNDLSAPGEEIVSTFPRSLTVKRKACVDQGYTSCASEEFRRPEGTSFAAPQVTAAAANLLATIPELGPDQVAAILTRSARDAVPATGCSMCTRGRDPFTGWGILDGGAALGALLRTLPEADRHEPNDDAGERAYPLYFPAGRPARGVPATLDFWDDPDDVYRVYLREGERLFTSLVARRGRIALALWRPGTASVGDLAAQDRRVVLSAMPGRRQRLAWTAAETGWHYLQARITAPGGPVPYRLSVVRGG